MVLVRVLLPLAVLCLDGAAAADVPEGPNQQCADDAGPPWGDSDTPYYQVSGGSQAEALTVHDAPITDASQCPPPLSAACSSKGVLGAHLDGPVNCGGQGWFCRIMPLAGWVNPSYNDRNFAHCNSSTADDRDNDGHCHGSNMDDVYGWWVRDHWFRGYKGKLFCCCDWQGLQGLVNRCDYRKHVSQAEQPNCRDANEELNANTQGQATYDGTCAAHSSVPFSDPAGTSDQCWVVTRFAAPGDSSPSPPTGTPDPVTPPAVSPSPAAAASPAGSSPAASIEAMLAVMIAAVAAKLF